MMEVLGSRLGIGTTGILLLSACSLLAACGRDRSSADTERSTPGEARPGGATSAAVTPAQPATTSQDGLSYEVDPDDVRAALAYESSTQTVTYPIVAGLTSTNNAWNFNGYANGDMTIIVPVGSNVVMPFSNLDANYPHSFGITADSPKRLPAEPGPPVFPGAATRRYEAGMRATEKDVVRFTASKVGSYLLLCGVPGHPTAGMWITFEVSESVKKPAIRTR